MLIDDDEDDNFIHQRAIGKVNSDIVIIAQQSAEAALKHLKEDQNKDNLPGLIFLDINMPGMNGWEFLEEYNKLDKSLQSKVIIIMLTTSNSDADKARAKSWNFVSDYITKPLTKQLVENILDKYFN
ncbi:response regulator [soil metagenome]